MLGGGGKKDRFLTTGNIMLNFVPRIKWTYNNSAALACDSYVK
jgi:hypothetical protein